VARYRVKVEVNKNLAMGRLFLLLDRKTNVYKSDAILKLGRN
jgi:hypothetical protein